MSEAAELDVVVIGSGFGGSTTALRLTEKGYRVAVLEAGRRFDESTLPKTSWRLRSFIWAPKLGCFGIQRISLIKDMMVLAGAGVGGGSLNYANTLYETLAPFYDDPQWGHIADWRDELLRTARRGGDEGHLPHLSRRLGELTHTNSEAILGARTFRRDVDFTKGVAVTSSFHPRSPDAHRTGALRQGEQRHGTAHHGAWPTAAVAPDR